MKDGKEMVDAYLDTNFNPSTEGGTIYTLNNASLAIYSMTDVAETKADIGARTTTSDYTVIMSRIATGLSSSRLHGATHPVVNGSVPSSLGLFSVMRNGADAASFYGYQNLDTITSSRSGVTTNIPNSKIFIEQDQYPTFLVEQQKICNCVGWKVFTPTD